MGSSSYRHDLVGVQVQENACSTQTNNLIPYGGKFWWGIYFGGLAVLRAICQYFHLSNTYGMSSLCTRYYVTSSTCGPPLFKTSTQRLQTTKEWNENSLDLVYHQLVLVQFNLLWFETDLVNRSRLLHCHYFAMNIMHHVIIFCIIESLSSI